jgi:hypothetical protein
MSLSAACPWVPAGVSHAIASALSKDPKKRLASVFHFLDAVRALERVRGGGPDGAGGDGDHRPDARLTGCLRYGSRRIDGPATSVFGERGGAHGGGRFALASDVFLSIPYVGPDASSLVDAVTGKRGEDQTVEPRTEPPPKPPPLTPRRWLRRARARVCRPRLLSGCGGGARRWRCTASSSPGAPPARGASGFASRAGHAGDRALAFGVAFCGSATGAHAYSPLECGRCDVTRARAVAERAPHDGGSRASEAHIERSIGMRDLRPRARKWRPRRSMMAGNFSRLKLKTTGDPQDQIRRASARRPPYRTGEVFMRRWLRSGGFVRSMGLAATVMFATGAASWMKSATAMHQASAPGPGPTPGPNPVPSPTPGPSPGPTPPSPSPAPSN